MEIAERTFRVERQVKLVFPAEFITCFAQCIVTHLCSGMPFCQVGGMGGYLIGDDTYTHILLIGQCQMLFGGDITEHGRTQPTYLCRADGRRNMVVTRCDVRHDGAERIERRIVAFFYLALHILLNLVHGHVAGTFDESLHILVPSTLHKLAHRVEFCKLRFIVGIVRRPRTQSVSQRDGHIILCQNIANVIKVFVKETLAVMHQAPFAHDAAATAHDTAQPFLGQMHIMAAYTGMDGEVVHSLLALFNQGVAVDFPGEVLHLAVHFLQCLVDGDSTYRNGTVTDNPFARFVDILPGGEVHQRVASPFTAPQSLFHLFFNAGGGGGVSDIGIYLHQEVTAYNHRLCFGMVDVGRKQGTSGGNLLAYKFRCDVRLYSQLRAVHVLANRHILHFRRDDALFGIVHLCAAFSLKGAVGQGDVLKAQRVERPVVAAHAPVLRRYFGKLLHIAAFQYPRLAQTGQPFLQIHFDGRVAERSAGIIHIHFRIRSKYLFSINEVRTGHLLHLAHSYAQFGKQGARQIYFLGTGEFYLLVHFSLGFVM